MSCANESLVPHGGELLNSLNDICRVRSNHCDQQVLTGGYQGRALAKSGSRKRLKSEGHAEQSAGAKPVREGDLVPCANEAAWDSSVAAMMMGCRTSAGGGSGLCSGERLAAGWAPRDALTTTVINSPKASARFSAALLPARGQDRQALDQLEDLPAHEVPMLNAARLAASTAVPTAASCFVPAPSREWRDQPYSALLSGPGFGYGVDGDVFVENDNISMGSAGSGSVDSGGFMIDVVDEDGQPAADGDGCHGDSVDSFPRSIDPSKSATTAQSGSSGRHTGGRGGDVPLPPLLLEPNAYPVATGMDPLFVWTPAPMRSFYGPATSPAVAPASGTAATSGVAGGAVSAAAVFGMEDVPAVAPAAKAASATASDAVENQPVALACQVGDEDDQGVGNLPSRMVSSESVGSGGVEEPLLAVGKAGDQAGAVAAALSFHASAPSVDGGVSASVASADGGSCGDGDKGAVHGFPNYARFDDESVGAARARDTAVAAAALPAVIAAMPIPGTAAAAGVYDIPVAPALQALRADASGGGEPNPRSLPPSMVPHAVQPKPAGPQAVVAVAAASEPRLPSLLPPQAYLGFISQLVDSVRTATRAAAEACYRHPRPHGPSIPVPYGVERGGAGWPHGRVPVHEGFCPVPMQGPPLAE